MPRPTEDTSYLRDRDVTMNSVGDLLEAAFAPWRASTEDLRTFKEHERSLFNAGSRLGCLVVSQATAYEFRWDRDGEWDKKLSRRSLGVLPGFWKTTNEDGIPLEQPPQLVRPVVVRL